MYKLFWLTLTPRLRPGSELPTTPDKEATGVDHPTPLYCPTCKRTGRPLINNISAATVGALRPAWLPAYAMISNRQITPTAVGVIYLGDVTPPNPTPFAVFEGVAGSYTPRGKIAQLS